MFVIIGDKMITKKLEKARQEQDAQKAGRARAAVRKMGRAIAATVLAAGLMLGIPKPAQADSMELMAGNRAVVLDLKASADITKRLGVFVRARPSIDYDGNVAAFGLADLTLNLSGGLDAVGEVQLIGGRAVPRAGVQYFRKAGDFSLYALATIGLDSAPYLESLAVLRYNPELRKNLRLLAQIEDVTDANPGGHDFSVQRMRLGVEWRGWGIGAAADLTETGNSPKAADGTFGYNAGGFISRRF